MSVSVVSPADPGQPQLPMSLRPPAPPAAAALLAQARRGLAEAEREREPAERFIGAYLAALRGAAAVRTSAGRTRMPSAAAGWPASARAAATLATAGWAGELMHL